MADYSHRGFNFNFNEPLPPSRGGPFQWDMQWPSVPAYSPLNDELRSNVGDYFGDNTSEGSVHTAFQEDMESADRTAPGVEEFDPPPSRAPSYMQANSPFSLDASVINERSFMEWYPRGKATLIFPGADNELESVQDINTWIIEERCPLLSAAFEESRSGPRLYLETLTTTTAFPFLRYLYAGSYAVSSASGDHFEDVPTSVLLHCQLYRLGDIYDLPELKSQAYVNVLRQCEFGCSSPDKPIDLCAAISYVYAHLSEHEKLVDAIMNYCVSCFISHRLAEDKEFKALAYELRPFHQALCRNTMERGFENETASAIIQLPYKPYAPATYASREERGNRFEDVVYHFHACDDSDLSLGKRRRVAASIGGAGNLSLALRQKKQQSKDAAPVAEESAAEEDGFTLIPKRRVSSSVAGSSDDEYEVLSGPALVEDISTDSESDTLAEVAQAARSMAALSMAASAAAETGENSSDSEWSMV